MEQQLGNWNRQIAGGTMAIGSLGLLAPISWWKERSTGRILLMYNGCTNGVTAPGVLEWMTRTMVGSKVSGLIHVLRTSGSGNSMTGRYSGNISMVTSQSSAPRAEHNYLLANSVLARKILGSNSKNTYTMWSIICKAFCHHVIIVTVSSSIFNIDMDKLTDKHTTLGLTGLLRRQIWALWFSKLKKKRLRKWGLKLVTSFGDVSCRKYSEFSKTPFAFRMSLKVLWPFFQKITFLGHPVNALTSTSTRQVFK